MSKVTKPRLTPDTSRKEEFYAEDNQRKSLKSDKELHSLSFEKQRTNVNCKKLSQKDILKNQDYAFFIGDEKVNRSIATSKIRLADISNCVTGIYCGDNKRFLAIECENQRVISGYPSVNENEIDFYHKSTVPIESPRKYISIIKGSSSTEYYRTADKWLIEWTESALHPL